MSKEIKRAGGVSEAAECLPSNCEFKLHYQQQQKN
jgi:hypothetical protein